MLHPELSSLGYAGVCSALDPHDLAMTPSFLFLFLFLPLLYLHVDAPGWGTLHKGHLPVCSLLWVRACKLCHPSPAFALGGEDGPATGSMEMQGTWGDMTGGEWCGQDKTYWASNYLQSFLTGQSFSLLNI